MTSDIALAQVEESEALVAACDERGVALRLLGGIAIAIHSGRGASPHREFSDLDGVIAHRDVRGLTDLLEERGYEGERRFNSLNADSRLIFYGPQGKLDVFVDRFEMCHKIPLADRLDVDSPTVSVTDLLLTKLQVIELNEKDVTDLALLVESHPVGGGEGDQVNADYLRRLLGRDWGLCKTVGDSVSTLGERAPALRERLAEIEAAIASAPRSLGFKLRGLVGEKVKWYDEPEEVGEED